MIETEVFQKNFVGRDGFIWWIGQVASDSWNNNQPGSSITTPKKLQNSIPGFDYRYQVRIMGYHTANKDELPDDQLPWAMLMYPVTAGGGFFTSSGPKIQQGNFVFGFFLDGEDAQQPMIMGVLGYNEYQKVQMNIPPVGFRPFGGYSNPILNSVATYSLTDKATLKDIWNPPSDEEETEDKKDDKKKKTAQVVTGPASTNQGTIETKKENKKGKRKKVIRKACESGATGIQKEIRNFIIEIQEVQDSLKEFKGDVQIFQDKVIKTQEFIEIKLKRAAKKVTGWIKDKIEAIMKWIINKIRNATKPILNLLHSDKKQDAKAGVENALELLVCAFKKIIGKLLDIVIAALTQALTRFINVPLCAAENILAAIIGKLMGLIESIVKMITGIINGVLGAVGIAMDLMDDLIGFLDAILSIFELCEPEKPECPRVTDWSIWDGSDAVLDVFDVNALVEKIKGFAAGVSDVVDPDNFDFDLDFSDVFDISMCDTGPRFCGPPELVFWGGSGTGTVGNAIIGKIGDIIGVDIVNTGHGYKEESPYLRFNDDCGNGEGAVGTAVTGPVSPTDLQPYRARRRNINKKPPVSPDDWEKVNLPTEGLPLWYPDVTYYGERIRTTPAIEELPAQENANLKQLYDNPVELRDGNFLTAQENGYQPACVLGVTTTVQTIIPADIVAFSPKWIPDDGGDYTGVVGVDMTETGFGYLPVGDGSQGGDGRTWADYDQTTVVHPNGEWDIPYSPGEMVPVHVADTIRLPIGSKADIYCMSGDVTEVLGGSNHTVSCDGVLTAPPATQTSLKPDNVYPIVLYACEAIINNPGFGYQDGDKVIIQPSNGAEITPRFGPFGNLLSLEVISGGEGFQEMPIAYIESETGMNAEISLRLCIDRVGDDITKEPGVEDKVISVVDCVGKV